MQAPFQKRIRISLPIYTPAEFKITPSVRAQTRFEIVVFEEIREKWPCLCQNNNNVALKKSLNNYHNTSTKEESSKKGNPIVCNINGIIVERRGDRIRIHADGGIYVFPTTDDQPVQMGDWISVEFTANDAGALIRVLKLEKLPPRHLSVPHSAGVLVLCRAKVPQKEKFALTSRLCCEIADEVADVNNCIPIDRCGHSIDVVVQYRPNGDGRCSWVVARLM